MHTFAKPEKGLNSKKDQQTDGLQIANSSSSLLSHNVKIRCYHDTCRTVLEGRKTTHQLCRTGQIKTSFQTRLD